MVRLTPPPGWKRWVMFVVPISAGLLGLWTQKQLDEGMRDFHNKSKLFGGKILAQGERVW